MAIKGKLFVVATPIGNLEDLSMRAIRIFKEADLIACEDTRQTKKILDHLNIHKPLTSVHQHSHPKQLELLCVSILEGKNIAVVTDAGTPAISDPGGRLVERARKSGCDIVPIPGPSALTTLVSVAGFGTDSFTFLGFPPNKRGRTTFFQHLADRSECIALFESKYRLIKTLNALVEHCGPDRELVIGRELTKAHEELFYGSIRQALEHFTQKELKGEFVLVLRAAAPKPVSKNNNRLVP